MSRPHLEPREHPEWMQREADAVAAHRRRETLRSLILPAAIGGILLTGAALGVCALMEFAP